MNIDYDPGKFRSNVTRIDLTDQLLLERIKLFISGEYTPPQLDETFEATAAEFLDDLTELQRQEYEVGIDYSKVVNRYVDDPIKNPLPSSINVDTVGGVNPREWPWQPMWQSRVAVRSTFGVMNQNREEIIFIDENRAKVRITEETPAVTLTGSAA